MPIPPPVLRISRSQRYGKCAARGISAPLSLSTRATSMYVAWGYKMEPFMSVCVLCNLRYKWNPCCPCVLSLVSYSWFFNLLRSNVFTRVTVQREPFMSVRVSAFKRFHASYGSGCFKYICAGHLHVCNVGFRDSKGTLYVLCVFFFCVQTFSREIRFWILQKYVCEASTCMYRGIHREPFMWRVCYCLSVILDISNVCMRATVHDTANVCVVDFYMYGTPYVRAFAWARIREGQCVWCRVWSIHPFHVYVWAWVTVNRVIFIMYVKRIQGDGLACLRVFLSRRLFSHFLWYVFWAVYRRCAACWSFFFVVSCAACVCKYLWGAVRMMSCTVNPTISCTCVHIHNFMLTYAHPHTCACIDTHIHTDLYTHIHNFMSNICPHIHAHT